MSSQGIDGECDNIAATEPSQHSEETAITSLNDDCLLEIFSYLPEVDLCAVKKSHDRFIESADAIFKKKYCSVDGDYIIPTSGKSFDVIERVLKYMHDVITRVRINSFGDKWSCAFNKCLSLLNCVSAMQHLCIAGCTLSQSAAISVQTFKKLESLTFVNCYDNDNSGVGTKFFLSTCHPLRLKTLRFQHTISTIGRHLSPDLLQFITVQLINIEELEIGTGTTLLTPSNVLKLRNLRKLKRLVMKCDESVSIVQIINALSKIESLKDLSLTYATRKRVDDDLAGAISNLKNVQQFTYSAYSSDLMVDWITGFAISYDYEHDQGNSLHKYTFVRY